MPALLSIVKMNYIKVYKKQLCQIFTDEKDKS